MQQRFTQPQPVQSTDVAESAQHRILLTGINGQVGFELARSLQGLGTVIGLDRRALDLSDTDAIRQAVQRERPTLIVNPAAYTAVDKAETDVAAARAINVDAPATLAAEASRLGIPLIQYSTDYVFDGTKQGPYLENDAAHPVSVYGRTKWEAEEAIRASGCAHLILRTSWVYGVHGGNFVKTMLRLGAEKPSLRIVADQFGAPTWARTIADLTAHIVAQSLAAGIVDGGVAHVANAVPGSDALDQEAAARTWWASKTGTYHLSAGGETTWAEFAKTIFAIKGLACGVEPIPASEYPTPAQRPANSRLSNHKLRAAFGLSAPDWETALRYCLASL